jgi:HlyD family secretion protein
MNRYVPHAAVVAALLGSGACQHEPAASAPRANGYVEATDVRVSSKVTGRVELVGAVEGQRVAAGDLLVRLSTTDADLALARARADRAQADAQWRLLKAGNRPEDIAQAEAQVAGAMAEKRAAESDLVAARADEARFEQLLQNRAGTQKQRDDAVARREMAEAKVKGAEDKIRASQSVVDRLKAGARIEEIQAASARVAAIDAQIDTFEHDRTEAVIKSPSAGIVSSRLVEPGELVTARATLIVLVDLDHAWASVYVEEPLVPTLRIDQPATVVTDAGDRIAGKITFISPQAEFTPRNVQTSAERAKLVYRVKVTVDNQKGVLKPGMPVEVEFGAGGGR